MPPIRLLPQPVAEAWSWQLEAACRGIDSQMFFSPDAERGTRRMARERVAKAVCRSCPVIAICREHALRAREPFGVWGGMTTEERRTALGADELRAQSA